MKKFPKIVQCDGRGQIVIPKDMRVELGIDEGTGFWMFSITEEGILLKMIPNQTISEDDHIMREITQKANKIDVKTDNVKKSVQAYKKRKGGRLEEI